MKQHYAPLCKTMTKSTWWCIWYITYYLKKGTVCPPVSTRPYVESVPLSPYCGICSHILPASLCLISPETMYSFSGNARASVSGEGGPSEQTPWEYQWPADCMSSGIGRCRHWGPRALWGLGPGSVSRHPRSLVSAPRWREGGMRRWSGSVFCQWWPHSPSCSARGSASTLWLKCTVPSGTSLGLTTDEELRQKLVLIWQASLREF